MFGRLSGDGEPVGVKRGRGFGDPGGGGCIGVDRAAFSSDVPAVERVTLERTPFSVAFGIAGLSKRPGTGSRRGSPPLVLNLLFVKIGELALRRFLTMFRVGDGS